MQNMCKIHIDNHQYHGFSVNVPWNHRHQDDPRKKAVRMARIWALKGGGGSEDPKKIYIWLYIANTSMLTILTLTVTFGRELWNWMKLVGREEVVDSNQISGCLERKSRAVLFCTSFSNLKEQVVYKQLSFKQLNLMRSIFSKNILLRPGGCKFLRWPVSHLSQLSTCLAPWGHEVLGLAPFRERPFWGGKLGQTLLLQAQVLFAFSGF
jgi:hypothetical protein